MTHASKEFWSKRFLGVEVRSHSNCKIDVFARKWEDSKRESICSRATITRDPAAVTLSYTPCYDNPKNNKSK